MAPPSRPTALMAALAVTVAAAAVLAGSGPSTSAQADPVVSVDAVSSGSNTATSVGTIDTCVATTTGATFVADVVIQGVTNIGGFQANLLYDPAVLNVTAVDYDFLLGSTGASVLDFGNTTPDADGDLLMAAAMFSLVPISGASGDGVLARLTFKGLATGSSPLNLTAVKLSDVDGIPIPPVDGSNFYAGPVNDASAAVDLSCGDSDGDTLPDPSDPCPLDPDCDGDGFTDFEEWFVGTDALDDCPDNLDDDAWPADMASASGFGKHDRTVNILDIVQLTPPVFNSVPPNPNYLARKDLNGDNTINILDVVRLTPPVFNQTCT